MRLSRLELLVTPGYTNPNSIALIDLETHGRIDNEGTGWGQGLSRN